MTRASRASRRAQRGSVTPLALVAALLLGVGGLSSAVLGGAVTAQRRAESAADLAALAGAAALQVAGDGCAAARDAARANGAALERCAVSGDEVEVTATRLLAVPVIGGVTVRGRARSGPSSITGTGPRLRPP